MIRQAIDVSFEWRGERLSGTLHLPGGDGPHPAVVMMQGSGPADRDGGGYFPPHREAFLACDLAVYSFDKPGCGASTGDWRDHALHDRADQALAALAQLLTSPAIDGARVGVWGQSQGGWVTQIVASRRPDLAFAVANSAPSIDVVSQDLHGCEHSMRASGHPEAHIAAALDFVRHAHAAARRGAPYEEVAELAARAAARPWYGYATIDDERDWALTTRFVQEAYQPMEALVRISCPFLAIYGGRDVLVPAWQSAQDTGMALERAGNPLAAVVVFPGGDHRIQADGDFVPGYLGLVATWVSQQVDAAAAVRRALEREIGSR